MSDGSCSNTERSHHSMKPFAVSVTPPPTYLEYLLKRELELFATVLPNHDNVIYLRPSSEPRCCKVARCIVYSALIKVGWLRAL